MKIIQYFKQQPIHEEYQKYINTISGHVNCEYQLLNKLSFEVDESKGYRYASDIARIKLACENPDMVWIDADVKLGSLGLFVPPNDGKPYFYSINKMANDICVFYVNGNTQFFKDIFNKFDKTQPLGWVQRLAFLNRQLFGSIPSGYFHHMILHSKIV